MEWTEQYLMMKRWFYRLQGQFSGGSDNAMSVKDAYQADCYWAFFVSCYHLKDYFTNSGYSDAEKHINKHEALRVCADICNRSKHVKRKPGKEREDASIKGHGRLYGGVYRDPYDNMERNVVFSAFDVISDSKKYDAFQLACRCIDAWNLYLKEKKLSTPKLYEEIVLLNFPTYPNSDRVTEEDQDQTKPF